MTLISSKLMYIGVISVIIIAVASYGLFFYFQRVNEKSIRESIFEQELERQINSTKSVSQHVGSDLRLVTSMLQDLADSRKAKVEWVTNNRKFCDLVRNLGGSFKPKLFVKCSNGFRSVLL